MTQPANENLLRKFRILVAPLDWGLGHAARCVPIVRGLLASDCDVWLAGEGQQKTLLRSEFPTLPFLPLKGYQIRYSKNNLALKIISQVPRILFSIRSEHSWLKRMVRVHQIDAVISDNRFGLYHRKIPAVFITHQLQIKSPFGNWSETFLRRWNYKYIDRFSECWVPDTDQQNGLAGELSHPNRRPHVPVRYVGLLSRFQPFQDFSPAKTEGRDHLLFILSGPEPQRSILEDKIVNDVSHYSGTATIVRGLPSSLSTIPSTGMIKFYNHLPTEELFQEIQRANWVISRCGYSTVMDLVTLKKKAVLIPTPGQTEQEHLASHLKQRHIALTIDQNAFSLSAALDEARDFNYQLPAFAAQQGLKTAIQNLLRELSA